MLGRPCSCCHPRVRSGRAGGLVLLCSLTLILGWLGSSCSRVTPQLDQWPRMKAFLLKIFFLCRLAIQSRFLLCFQRVFRESCLMPLRPALESLYSMHPNTIKSALGPLLACRARVLEVCVSVHHLRLSSLHIPCVDVNGLTGLVLTSMS